jgi:hypothetical protein
MAGKLSRFLKLERPRAAGGGEPRPPVSSGRFEPESDLEELRRERRRQLESGVVLDDRQDSEQPFLRCALCEQDNNRFASRCQNCGADLTLDEQRAFNARLWAERREQAAREQAELARFHAASTAAATLPANGTLEYGEALALQVAERENRRLAWMDDGAVDARPVLGLRLLNSIPNPSLRFAAALGLLGLALILGYLSFRAGTSNQFSIAQVFFFALLMLFLPRRRRWRGRWGRWFFDD